MKILLSLIFLPVLFYLYVKSDATDDNYFLYDEEIIYDDYEY